MSTYGKANDSQRIHLVDLHEWNTDKTVQPHTMVRGMMGKDHDAVIHAWRYLRVSSSGAISNDDAANFRVSAVGLTGLDISNDDAADFRVSSFSDDGALFRVSSIESSHSANGTGRLTASGINFSTQLSSVACKRAIIQGLPNNASAVVLGTSDVTATASARNSVGLWAGQSKEFKVTNLNLLHMAIEYAGEGISIYYEQ